MPAPPARPPASRALVVALLALTFTTGMVDAVSYLGLGRVFTANMTGNVVLLGFGLAGVAGLPVLAPLVSLAAFCVGAGAAGLALRRIGTAVAAPALGVAVAIEGVLILGATAIAAAGDVRGGTVAAGVIIALLALAMGVRNAIVRKLAVPDLTTTVLTMTITGLAADGPTVAPAVHGRRLASLVAILLGAFAGALLVKSALWPALAVAAATALAIAAWTRVTSAH
jgi:uncharacterized membrane protein YoaK (UPF0700 family)